MIVDCAKLVGSMDVDDVQLVTVGDLLNLDRVSGLQGGLEEFERRYPSRSVTRCRDERASAHETRGRQFLGDPACLLPESLLAIGKGFGERTTVQPVSRDRSESTAKRSASVLDSTSAF